MPRPALPDTRELLAGLNARQKKAVTHGRGPLLIIAGAGTGKTKVITHRIAYLIAAKLARPDEILAVTFTEKAANEMEERVDRLIPYSYAFVDISTFNSFGERVLRNYALDLGYPPDFRLLDDVEQAVFVRSNLFRLPLRYYRPLSSPTRHIQELLGAVKKLKQEDISPGEYLEFARKLESGRRQRGGPGDGAQASRDGGGLCGLRGASPERREDRFRGPGPAGGAPLPRAAVGAGRIPEQIQVHPGRRIPGHELHPVRAPEDAGPATPEPDRGGRRRPEHLPLPGRLAQQHPQLPAGLSQGQEHRPDDELPFGPAHPRLRLQAHPAERSQPPGIPEPGGQAAAGHDRAIRQEPPSPGVRYALPRGRPGGRAHPRANWTRASAWARWPSSSGGTPTPTPFSGR